ncbi:YdeI/OmpD-associated family protein [Mucilaginibacter agri]|uniref:YdhG-like domain-containing protein n=1 Tax=Mucilaginibacter agri TaxID=2695265 RepID=A0A965ZGY8_9SPHI|nr:YdeI/OmpD-associated family protein [Mucilaginibacter agri]NCD70878.1 hypothetical protein [Mucilaginibacter agri]
MAILDPRVDAYIAKVPAYAKPVLEHFRDLVHQADPDIKETIKWGHVHFDLKSPICYMAAFKAHCRMGFWHSGMLPDPEGWFKGGEEEGRLYKITGLADMPPDEIILWYLKNAIDNNKQGIKPSKAKAQPKAKVELSMPDDFDELLNGHAAARDNYENFSPSKRREYLEWFADAKTDATRLKRLNTAIEWIAEGKSRNWKYQ